MGSPTAESPHRRVHASHTGQTTNSYADPVHLRRSFSPLHNDQEGAADTHSTASRSRGFNRLFTALDDAASQSFPRGSASPHSSRSSRSSSSSSSSTNLSLSGGSLPAADLASAAGSHATKGGSTYSGATVPAVKETTDLLSKFASRMVSQQWRSSQGVTEEPRPAPNHVVGRGAIVFDDGEPVLEGRWGLAGSGSSPAGASGGMVGSSGDQDDVASVQHSTFTTASQLTGGGPSLMHSNHGSVYTMSMLSGTRSKASGWSSMLPSGHGADDVMSNAFGVKMQRNALLFAIVDENVRTQSRSDPQPSPGVSTEYHWGAASASFGSPPKGNAPTKDDVLPGHNNQSAGLSTTASPSAKFHSPVAVRGGMGTPSSIHMVPPGNTLAYSMTSLSRTAPHEDRRVVSPIAEVSQSTQKYTHAPPPPPATSKRPPSPPTHCHDGSRSLSASLGSGEAVKWGLHRGDGSALPPPPAQPRGSISARPEPLQHPVNVVIPHAPRGIKVVDENGRPQNKILRYRPTQRDGPSTLARFVDMDTTAEEHARLKTDFEEAVGAYQQWPGKGHVEQPRLAKEDTASDIDHTFTTFHAGAAKSNHGTSCETTFVSFGTGLPVTKPLVALRAAADDSDRSVTQGGTLSVLGSLPAPRTATQMVAPTSPITPQQRTAFTVTSVPTTPSHRNRHSLSNGDLSSDEDGVMGGWGEGALPTPSIRHPFTHQASSSNPTVTTFGTEGLRSGPSSGNPGSDETRAVTPGVTVPVVRPLAPPARAEARPSGSLSGSDISGSGSGDGVLGDVSLPMARYASAAAVEVNPTAVRKINAPWTRLNTDKSRK